MASRRTAGDGVRDKRRAPAGSLAADARLVAAALEAACVAGTEAQTSLSAEAAGQRAERDKVEAEMVA